MKIVSLSIYSILTTLMTDELTRQDDCYNESSQSLDADINFDSCNAEPSKMSHINNYDTEISELYKKYAAKMINAIRTMFGNGPPEPQDIVHHAFHKLIERPTLSDIKNLHGFLWRTARNAAMDNKRHEAIRAKYDFEVENMHFACRTSAPSPESQVLAEAELTVINDTLGKMPVKRRRAFILHKIEHLPVTEVARRLNISRTPAQKHIDKAVRDIDVALKGHNQRTQK